MIIKEISYLEGAFTLLEQQKIMMENPFYMMKSSFNTVNTAESQGMKIEDFESMKE